MQWCYKTNIKPLLEAFDEIDFITPNELKALGIAITELLEPWAEVNARLPQVLGAILYDLRTAPLQYYFDQALERLYDWADSERVWLGV